MASFTTILLFFVYLWGFGYTATLWVKNAENIFERNLMRIGIGFAGFALMSVLLNLFRISIDWKIFLILSLLGPTYSLIRTYRNKTLRIPEKLQEIGQSSLFEQTYRTEGVIILKVI